MFAIAVDMLIADLKQHSVSPYNNAYYEIKSILRKYDFYNMQGSGYLTENDDMANLYMAIDALKVSWFKKSVRDIRAFRVEDWSDFTSVVKEE
jgi:virulence-associated protein VapD